jgi:hypothetical protein
MNKLAKVHVRIRQHQLAGILDTPDLPAAVDTGASDCFTRTGVLGALGFIPHGSWTPPGSSASFQSFDIEIGISNAGQDLAWFPVKLMEVPNFPFASEGCELAIGNAFLQNCRFVYDGPKGEFTLEW